MTLAKAGWRNRIPTDWWPVIWAFVIAGVIFCVGTVISPSFASPTSVGALLLTASFIGIAALGQTFVILGGGIDLSIPLVMTCSAVFVARAADGDTTALGWAIPVILLLAGIVGILNGVGVTLLRVSPIVMTLGMSGVLQGLLLLGTQGKGSPAAPEGLTALSKEGFGSLSYLVLIWFGLILVATVVLTSTRYGRGLYAVGSNRTVAELSGLRASAIGSSTYVISAISAAIAGIFLVSYTTQPFLSMGQPYLFASIAAVAVGGTSILGGQGSYLGTVAGALLLTVLAALLPVLGLSQAALLIIYGVVILVALTVATGRVAPFSRNRSIRHLHGVNLKDEAGS